jgi:hypothetical protein
MAELSYCPLTGKFYIIICMTIIFTTLLVFVNVLEHNENGTDNTIFKVGIAVNVLSFLLTLYIIKIDIMDIPKKSIKSCMISSSQNLAITFVFTVCSSFLLVFGIIRIDDIKDSQESEYSKMTNITIGSIIIGSMGILYILNELLVSFIHSRS